MRGKASNSPPKGKIAAYLGIADNYEIAVRTGSVNAGHTVFHEGKELKLRIIPCAFVNPKTRLLISAGALFSIDILFTEMEVTNSRGRVGIDANSGIITNEHIEKERKNEFLMKIIGSTGSGVGVATVDRILRIMKLAKDYEELTPFVTDVASEIHECIDRDGSVLIEGTQGLFLSLYHGTYPYVTSRDVSASGVCSEVGIGPKDVDEVIVVFKSYVTRVGGGPLEGEISEEEAIKRGWMEVASVTRRKRRVAPFNLKMAERAIKINSATQIALTKLDALFPECRGLREYDKLPKEAKNFIEEIENRLKVPVTIIGTGPSTLEVIDRRIK